MLDSNFLKKITKVLCSPNIALITSQKKKDLLENCFLASTPTSLGLRCCLYILKGTETIHFSSFQYHFQSIEQARLGPKMGLDFNCTTMAIITVVPQIPQITSTTYHYFTKENGFTQNTRTQPY